MKCQMRTKRKNKKEQQEGGGDETMKWYEYRLKSCLSRTGLEVFLGLGVRGQKCSQKYWRTEKIVLTWGVKGQDRQGCKYRYLVSFPRV